MALILKQLWTSYNWLMTDVTDSRTKDMLLANVLTPLIISVVYHRLVYKWGPKFMEIRQPYNLRIMLIAYNLIQIVINVYCTHISLKRVIVQNWKCAPVDYSNSPEALDEIHATKVYYFLKLLDLTDTVFFLLRKSYRQITFLHTYHHIGMIWTPWIGLRFIPGGHGAWISLINSFVHAMMYSYYLLTAIDERWKKNIEIKKFLTQMQIIQFVLMVIIFGRPLLQRDCNYPHFVSYVWVTQNIFIGTLFIDFYRKSYLQKKE